MAKNSSSSWIRVYDDTYDDCIVGNREGLQVLAKALDSAVTSSSDVEIAGFTNTNISIIHCTDDPEPEIENSDQASLPLQILGILLFIWVTVLPILGVVWLFQILRD